MGLPGDIIGAKAAASDPGRLMLHGRALRYIDEVARQGSIRQAARVLDVSPSAVNRFVLAIEEDLGVPIFERLPKGLQLTTPGEMLLAHIRDTLRAHERMRAQVRGLSGLAQGEVTVATMATLAAGRLADLVAGFRDAYPQVSLRVLIGTRPELIETVISGRAELVLGYNLPQDARLHRAAEFQVKLGAVVARDHPLATRRSVRLSDCLTYPLVSADASLSLREAVENLMPAHGRFIPAIETNSTELMKHMVRRQPHITFLNRLDVEQEIQDGDLVFLPLEGPAGRQKLVLCHRARGALSPAASRFLSMAHRMFEGADGDPSLIP
jgi:DNA-binding transcriptional LysR family regulator